MYISMLGLVVTAGTYAVLAASLVNVLWLPDSTWNLRLLLLGCQFLSILAGTLFNYELNRVFTWPQRVKDVDIMPAVQSSLGTPNAAAANTQSTSMDAQQQAQ